MRKLQKIKVENLKAVITYTFNDSQDLGIYFVEALKEIYQEKNVIYIDQSTYGIANHSVEFKDLKAIMLRAEEKGEKCKGGDELAVINIGDTENLLLTIGSIYDLDSDK